MPPHILTLKQMDDLGLLRQFNRDPFRKVLAQWLRNAPRDEDIIAAAKKSPDRWAQGTAILGRLAGYSDRIEVDQSLTVHHLSDAELEARIAHLSSSLRALPASPARTVKAPKSHDQPDTASTPLPASPSPHPDAPTARTAPLGEPLSITAAPQHALGAGDTHRPSPGPARARARSQRSAAQAQG